LTPFAGFLRLEIACLRGVVTAIVVVLLMQTFLVEGLLMRFVVTSASMSPTLRGPHYVLCCPECTTVFYVETEDEARSLPNELPLRRGTCPACAFAQVPVPADTWRNGDRIYVNRAALSLRAVRRWDVVLFRSPEDGKLTIKRVVGLPGETLEIRDGDIYINGQIAVKPLAVQHTMRIPVQYGRWEMQPRQLSGTMELAWYPIRNVPHAEPLPIMTTLYGVTNQLCENQWCIEPSGGIFPVRDLMLEFDWLPEGKKGLRVEAGGIRFEILPPPSSCLKSHACKITVSLFDRQWLVAVDDVIIIEKPFDETQHSTDKQPFTISLPENDRPSHEEQEASFVRQITNLRVWRDVYYTNNQNNASTTSVVIPADCYYLLGDSSNFSSDSRSWKEPFVTQRNFIGIVGIIQQ